MYNLTNSHIQAIVTYIAEGLIGFQLLWFIYIEYSKKRKRKPFKPLIVNKWHEAAVIFFFSRQELGMGKAFYKNLALSHFSQSFLRKRFTWFCVREKLCRLLWKHCQKGSFFLLHSLHMEKINQSSIYSPKPTPVETKQKLKEIIKLQEILT